MDDRRTLLFLVKDDQILLALKKRGFGTGLWNGVGGKIEPNESIEQAMIRECQEEICITPTSYNQVANIDFYGFDNNKPFHLRIYAYVCALWQGEPSETDEMQPKWYEVAKIPYDKMWDDDKYWLPLVLQGSKITGKFHLDAINKVYEHSIQKVAEL